MHSWAQHGERSERAISRFLGWLAYVAGGLLICMMLLTVVHVVGRYALNRPVFGQSEIVGLAQVLLVSVSGAYTMLERRHVTIGILADRLSKRQQAALDLGTHVLALVLTSIASWQTFGYATALAQEGKTTDMLKIAFSPFFYAIAVGWALLSLGLVVVAAKSLCDLTRRPSQGVGE